MRLGPLTLCLLPLACATPGEARAPAHQTAASIIRHGQEGQATFYGESFRGTTTASGERFDPEALTAAHRTLRLGTRVEVQSLRGPERVVVRINDRGPFGNPRRIIDVSVAAARRLNMLRAGVIPVRLRVLP